MAACITSSEHCVTVACKPNGGMPTDVKCACGEGSYNVRLQVDQMSPFATIPFFHGSFGDKRRHSIYIPCDKDIHGTIRPVCLSRVLRTQMPDGGKDTLKKIETRIPLSCAVDFQSDRPIEVKKVGIRNEGSPASFVCSQVIPNADSNTKRWVSDWVNAMSFQKSLKKEGSTTANKTVHVLQGLIMLLVRSASKAHNNCCARIGRMMRFDFSNRHVSIFV
jgi:hypothetical protein